MKFIHSNTQFKDRRKELRKNATPQEVILWSYLRGGNPGYKFRRQHSIGPYIVDFYCAEKRLIIEVDGDQHNDKDSRMYDSERSNYFKDLNHIVIRFWNNDINNNIESVLEEIVRVLRTAPSRRLDTPPKLGGVDC